MKIVKAALGRTVDQPDGNIRLYLFHGPDDSQSRALGARLVQALGASRFLLPSGTVRSDPATLADEAGAMSLFGGARVIWIEPAGEDIVAGVEALLEGPAPVSPVVAIAGALRKTSGLLKLAEASKQAVAYAAYAPEGAEAGRMVSDVGRRYGLKIDGAVASRVAASCSNDQALVAQELQKLALYLDASPQAPKALDHDAIDAVGAEMVEGDLPRLADLALAGDVRALAEELAQLPHGAQGIPVVRALQRRLLMLAPARARVERGESVDGVMTSLGRVLFWKDKAVVGRMLQTWDARGLATVSERAGRLERDLMFSKAPEQEMLGEELLAIARAARRR
ncbi:DNA polymerase III subunit delta [Sphingomonas lutea]|uniref:DNA-directed DNA polymerase n=1 Tax=Sphingomonas lutea TaxID=1045317 RepID=A0A7G9SIH2_9SPHN|nr:DNA polymerase III subunit delta [Sphingomonas lutea]QNN67647.1 DNA polymerase III subunit delta [Sphingomonas lutea]